MFKVVLANGVEISFNDYFDLTDKILEAKLGFNENENIKSLVFLGKEKPLDVPCENLKSVESLCELIGDGFEYLPELLELIKENHAYNGGDWRKLEKTFSDMFIFDLKQIPKREVDEKAYFDKIGRLIAKEQGIFAETKNTQRPSDDSIYAQYFNFAEYGKDHIERDRCVEYRIFGTVLFQDLG